MNKNLNKKKNANLDPYHPKKLWCVDIILATISPYFALNDISQAITDFGQPQHILPGSSASCAPKQVAHTNQ